MSNTQKIANQLNITKHQVAATIELLDADNTVPFISRYRKEVTGGLDEVQIREIKDLSEKLKTLDERRETILKTIAGQGKLSDKLTIQIQRAETRTELEDIYQPYKPKRKTRASSARDKGLQPLADLILMQPVDLSKSKSDLARPFINDEVTTIEDAWFGARDIVAETISDNLDIRRTTREKALQWGMQTSFKIKSAEDHRGIYESYYDFEFKINRLRPHQILAMNRGEKDKVLRLKINIPERDWRVAVKNEFPVDKRSPLAEQLDLSIEDSARRLLLPAIERALRRSLTEKAETHAIQVFATNLRNLLSQPPLADHVILGIDPGYRTGSKVAVIDSTGKPLGTATIYPHPPQNLKSKAFDTLKSLIINHDVSLIAIGNGTASRETEGLIAELLQTMKTGDNNVRKSTYSKKNDLKYLMVSEAGASVYSASKLAREELPKMDVSMRGAVSIARRVQDPLAELVKIDPKSIGVGMYQHDIDQKRLSKSLDDVVESVVNLSGVDVNSASSALLTFISGIGPSLASRIVKYRDSHGPFRDRQAIRKVTGFGPKVFEQSGGFLRIRDAVNPLDASSIHPESYSIAEKVLKKTGLDLDYQPEDREGSLNIFLSNVSVEDLAAELGTGVPTLEDILEQLIRPGRDPRDDLPPPILRSDVLKVEDLTTGMQLMGTVRNVVDFGAFIDIGVKQDGLLHRSQIPQGGHLAAGDVIQVAILKVEIERGRIGLGWSGRVEPNHS